MCVTGQWRRRAIAVSTVCRPDGRGESGIQTARNAGFHTCRVVVGAVAAIVLAGCGGGSPFDTTVSGPHIQLFTLSGHAPTGGMGHPSRLTVRLPEGYQQVTLDWTYRCPRSDGLHWRGMDVNVELRSTSPGSGDPVHGRRFRVALSPSDESGSRSVDLTTDDRDLRLRIAPHDSRCAWSLSGYAT